MKFKVIFNLIILTCFGVYKYFLPSSFFASLLFLIYIFLLIYFLFIRKGNKKLKLFVETCMVIGITIFTLGLGIILKDIYSSKNIEVINDYVIILGAGLRGDKPTTVLRYRLEKALEYYKKYPNTIFIVSGGQGKDEIISESQAMKNYLVSHSIPENNIIEENKSTSTLENLIFSHKYIPKNSKNIGVISNDFHLYRVKFFANILGYNLNPIYAKTPLINAPSYFSRESLAVLHYTILKKPKVNEIED